MGAAPSIDGGMTEAEYKKLQMEEREFQAGLEKEAYARAEESEAKRLSMEETNKEQLAAQEDAEKNAIQQSELALQGELADMDDDDDDNLGAVDFYGALSQGQASTDTDRPE